MVRRITHGGIIHQARPNRAAPVCDHARARTHEIIFHGWKTIVDKRPLWGRCYRVPVIVNVSEIKLLLNGDIVVYAKKFFSTGGELRHRGVVTRIARRIATFPGVWRRYPSSIENGG